MKQISRFRLWLAAIILTFPFMASAASPEAGKVYQLVNDQYKTAATANGPDGSITCSAADNTKFAQLWKAEDAGSRRIALRNLATGRYLKSSGGQSQPWGLETEIGDYSSFSFTAKEIGGNTVYNIRSKGTSGIDRGFMHCDAQAVVVCWDASAATSQWLLNEVSVTDEEIAGATSAVERVNEIIANADSYAEILGRIFADAACTKLAGTPSEADLAALPTELREMVKKVQTGDWSEVNNNDSDIKWDSKHALRFRVRDYQVFSRDSDANNMLGAGGHTNMNNPTGIMGNAYDVLFIMVDQDPKDGSTLYFRAFAHNGMENGWDGDIQLHRGLNIVPVWGDNNMGWIYYTASTWQGGNNGRPSNKLSDFPKIKIHIEGGVVNSYWDKNIDTEEDWFYYRDRARHPMYDILGDFTHIRFFLDYKGWGVADAPTAPGLRQVLAPGADRNIVTAINSWDTVYLGEHLAMGTMSDEQIDKYGKGYYNHNADDKIAPRPNFRDYHNGRHMGIEAQDVKNPNGSYWRSMYPAGNPHGMMDVIDGDIWCLHHEAGHTFQAPINLVGQTEMSNNGLANIATFYSSNRTSRTAYINEAAQNFANGGIFQENELWSCVRMYYQLWLYYHAAGYNKNFFPRLYEQLRREPIIHHPVWQDIPTKQLEDGLRFAKAACIAAQEDLTEFFEGWGFLTPCDNFLVGDYTNHYLSLSQAEADAWRAEIKALGFPENITPLFIDERPGQTERVNYPEYRFFIENAGELGGLVHFQAKTRVTKPYTYAVSGKKVTMEGGEGGIGFVVRDDKGKLLGYSNSLNFPISAKAASLLLEGKAHIYALGEGRDTKPTLCESTMSSASPEKRAELLQNLVESAAPYVDNIDDEGRIVGKYKASVFKGLRDLTNDARKALADKDADRYEDLFNRLSSEYYSVDGRENAQIAFIPGSVYHVVNKAENATYDRPFKGQRRGRFTFSGSVDLEDDAQWWKFEKMDDSHYSIKNIKYNQYIQGITEGDGKEDYKLGDAPVPFSLGQPTPFDFCFYPNDTWNHSINYNPQNGGRWIGYTGDNNNSQFRLTLIEADPLGEARVNLDDIITETEILMAEAGKIDAEPRPVPVPLGEEDSYYFSNAKCKSTQYGDQFVSFNVLNDTTSGTFFHSDYSGADSDDGLDHYIGIDLGGGKEEGGMTVSSFHIIYTTRGSGNACAPKSVTVQGSADGKEWIDIAEITSGLPSENDTEYVSDVLTAPKPVRYVRMVVHTTYGGQNAGGHQYFIVSEFSIANANFTAIPAEKYPAVTADLLKDVHMQLKSSKATRATVNDPELLGNTAAELRSQYARLADAMGITTGIEGIEGDATESIPARVRGIYDLSGRRLRSADAPGLYIIDGRKVLVR